MNYLSATANKKYTNSKNEIKTKELAQNEIKENYDYNRLMLRGR